ncbi:MAG: hypothetical protein M3R29_03885, partial [Verrucomicrobiota bacterium]|nr:hypothetical protein [Verrucomicrobiota bacterium]
MPWQGTSPGAHFFALPYSDRPGLQWDRKLQANQQNSRANPIYWCSFPINNGLRQSRVMAPAESMRR